MSITDEIHVLTQPVHPSDWTDLDTKLSIPPACSPPTRFRRSATAIPELQ